MDIWIGGHSAVELLRMARSGRWPRLHESNSRIVGHSSAGVGRTWREAVSELGQYLDVFPSHPLMVRVADGAHRIRSSVVDCKVNASVLPSGSFLIVELDAFGTSVHIDAPEHQLLSLARHLSPLVSMGRMDRPVALAVLAEFGMELCGTYARNPRNPYGEDCHYGTNPVTDPNRLSLWLNGVSHVKGARLAKASVRHIRAGSASPVESTHAILLGFPVRWGGIALGDFQLNAQLVMSRKDMSMLGRTSFRPDLYFPRYRLAIEHYGAEWHGGIDRMAEDATRTQCYAALGIRVYPTTARDCGTAVAYESFLRKLAEGLGHDLGERHRRMILGRLEDFDGSRVRAAIIDELAHGASVRSY